MAENRNVRLLLYFFYAALIVLAIWLLLRFALPWLAPFILALITARLIEPVVKYFKVRFRFRRGFASAVCTILVLAMMIGLFILIISKAIYQLVSFVKDLPALLSGFTAFISSLEERINGYILAAPAGMQEYLLNVFDSISKKSAEFPAELSGRLLGYLSTAASYAPKIVLFILTYSISLFFFSSSYPEVTGFIMRQIPKRCHQGIYTFKSDLIVTMGKWLKAQLMLCIVTFFELTAAFLLLRIDYAFILALMISAIDALPVFGTGTILIPWALYSLLSGNLPRAIALIVIYFTVAVVRSFLEPKLIGHQIGLHPAATLLALYIGFSCAGVAGMVLFPISLIMAKQLNDRKYIKLWK